MAARIGLDREDVVNVAVELLAEHGPKENVSLGEVAGRLGIRTQSLYAHIDGADGLRRQLALRGLRSLAECLGQAAMGRAGRDAVAAIIRRWLEFAAEQPGLYAATLRPPGQDRELAAATEAAMRPLMVVLDSYGLSEEAVCHWHRLIFAAVHGFAILAADHQLTMPGDPEVTVSLMIDMFATQLATAGQGAPVP